MTSPLACELLLPWLAEEDRDAALGYVWQAAAALHVAYDIDRLAPAPTAAPPSAEILVDRALASGDEHAIKLTEAALRSFGSQRQCRAPAGRRRRLRPPLTRLARGARRRDRG